MLIYECSHYGMSVSLLEDNLGENKIIRTEMKGLAFANISD